MTDNVDFEDQPSLQVLESQLSNDDAATSDAPSELETLRTKLREQSQQLQDVQTSLTKSEEERESLQVQLAAEAALLRAAETRIESLSLVNRMRKDGDQDSSTTFQNAKMSAQREIETLKSLVFDEESLNMATNISCFRFMDSSLPIDERTVALRGFRDMLSAVNARLISLEQACQMHEKSKESTPTLESQTPESSKETSDISEVEANAALIMERNARLQVEKRLREHEDALRALKSTDSQVVQLLKEELLAVEAQYSLCQEKFSHALYERDRMIDDLRHQLRKRPTYIEHIPEDRAQEDAENLLSMQEELQEANQRILELISQLDDSEARRVDMVLLAHQLDTEVQSLKTIRNQYEEEKTLREKAEQDLALFKSMPMEKPQNISDSSQNSSENDEIQELLQWDIDENGELVENKMQTLSPLSSSSTAALYSQKDSPSSIVELETQLRSTQDILKEKETCLMEFQAQADEAEVWVQNADKIIESLTAENHQLRLKLGGYTTLLPTVMNELTSLLKIVANLEHQLRSVHLDVVSNTQKSQHQEVHSALTKRVRELEGHLKQSEMFEATIQVLQYDSNALRASVDTLEQRAQNEEARRKKAENEIYELENKLVEGKRDQAQLEAKMADLQYKLKVAETTLTSTQTKMDAQMFEHRKEMQTAVTAMRTADNYKSQLKNMVATLFDEASYVQTYARKSKNEIEALKMAVRSAELETETYRIRCSRLERECRDIELKQASNLRQSTSKLTQPSPTTTTVTKSGNTNTTFIYEPAPVGFSASRHYSEVLMNPLSPYQWQNTATNDSNSILSSLSSMSPPKYNINSSLEALPTATTSAATPRQPLVPLRMEDLGIPRDASAWRPILGKVPGFNPTILEKDSAWLTYSTRHM